MWREKFQQCFLYQCLVQPQAPTPPVSVQLVTGAFPPLSLFSCSAACILEPVSPWRMRKHLDDNVPRAHVSVSLSQSINGKLFPVSASSGKAMVPSFCWISWFSLSWMWHPCQVDAPFPLQLLSETLNILATLDAVKLPFIYHIIHITRSPIL